MNKVQAESRVKSAGRTETRQHFQQPGRTSLVKNPKHVKAKNKLGQPLAKSHHLASPGWLGARFGGETEWCPIYPLQEPRVQIPNHQSRPNYRMGQQPQESKRKPSRATRSSRTPKLRSNHGELQVKSHDHVTISTGKQGAFNDWVVYLRQPYT